VLPPLGVPAQALAAGSSDTPPVMMTVQDHMRLGSKARPESGAERIASVPRGLCFIYCRGRAPVNTIGVEIIARGASL
jgi:hypothetical protein